MSLAFASKDKTEFEQCVLYPLAGIDAGNAKLLEEINQLAKLLRYSRIAIAQQYLDGYINRAEAVNLTVQYSMVSEKRAESSVSFIEQYRAYVLNYSIGEDIISDYIAAHANTEAESWAEFKKLLTQLKAGRFRFNSITMAPSLHFCMKLSTASSWEFNPRERFKAPHHFLIGN